jgi:hypothetical protein
MVKSADLWDTDDSSGRLHRSRNRSVLVERKVRARLQFGAEVFNLSNHSNPLRVSPYYASRDRQLDSYGQALETLNARQIQWLVQLEY